MKNIIAVIKNRRTLATLKEERKTIEIRLHTARQQLARYRDRYAYLTSRVYHERPNPDEVERTLDLILNRERAVYNFTQVLNETDARIKAIRGVNN